MISEEIAAKITRLYFGEKWKKGTIATQLGLHHHTVSRVINQSSESPSVQMSRPSKLDPYLPYMKEVLEQYPKLTATRLYQMVRERGYQGGADYFRFVVRRIRPTKKHEAFLRRTVLPGEEAQVDWGHFGSIQIGRVKRPLCAFVMVLSWSRRIYLKFFLNQNMSSFLTGHENAFLYFKGIPKVCLYDNLRSVVTSRDGNYIQFNETFTRYFKERLFEPRPVGIARGNEKGRVERTIRYIRSNFFAGLEFKTLEELNQKALTWCEAEANQRKVPGQDEQKVMDAFLYEQKLLTSFENRYPTYEQVFVRIGKSPYARFDLNDYSVPHAYVKRGLTVRATATDVRIYDGETLVCEHVRSWDKGASVENRAHIEALIEHKHAGKKESAQSRLLNMVPKAEIILTKISFNGGNVGSTVNKLLDYIEQHGVRVVRLAVEEVVNLESPSTKQILFAIDRMRIAQGRQPALASTIVSANPAANGIIVNTHSLNTYDNLISQE